MVAGPPAFSMKLMPGSPFSASSGVSSRGTISSCAAGRLGSAMFIVSRRGPPSPCQPAGTSAGSTSEGRGVGSRPHTAAGSTSTVQIAALPCTRA
jgi:hypothetical protein